MKGVGLLIGSHAQVAQGSPRVGEGPWRSCLFCFPCRLAQTPGGAGEVLAVVGPCPGSPPTLGGTLGRRCHLLQPPRLELSRLTCVTARSLLVLLDRLVLETRFLS